MSLQEKSVGRFDCGVTFISSIPSISAQCDKSAQAPFEAKTGRPVCCRECYEAINNN